MALSIASFVTPPGKLGTYKRHGLVVITAEAPDFWFCGSIDTLRITRYSEFLELLTYSRRLGSPLSRALSHGIQEHPGWSRRSAKYPRPHRLMISNCLAYQQAGHVSGRLDVLEGVTASIESVPTHARVQRENGST